MKVRIDAGGRAVEIECPDVNATYTELADKALYVWQATDAAKVGAGPAVGFSTHVAAQPSRGVTSMRQEPLRVTSEVDG